MISQNKKKYFVLLVLIGLIVAVGVFYLGSKKEENKTPKSFVSINQYIPSVLLEIRYATNYNMIGHPLPGYHSPQAFLTKQAASALKKAADDLQKQGYVIKIYDAYRPQRAVDALVKWSQNNNTKMKPYFYPELSKDELFPKGYIAKKSGHTRGSTVDITLVRMSSGKELDMGSPFDLFSPISHHNTNQITEKQSQNRKLLKKAMEQHGFLPYKEEWWHYTLKNEPYPDTYFNFEIN